MLPELFIFWQVGKGARIVLKIAYQAVGQVLPTMKMAAAARIEDELQEVQFLTSCYLF